MWGANLSGTFNALRVIYKPQLCMPQVVISDFSKLQIPLCFKQNRIKAVVLDKDNTFAKPYDEKVYAGYQAEWDHLKQCYPGAELLIVSNTAGTSDDKNYMQAEKIEKTIRVPVLRHKTKKPGCYREVMAYFKEKGVCNSPKEVAVVGDRLFTDVMMANLMGSYGVWISDGVVPNNQLVSKMEKHYYQRLLSKGYRPLDPCKND